ncbi:hypothetical protein [Sutterella sp.]|uniref:hypothetical protein n=1 Tax=Sutterella sp. TaxID=1981025 RepID=UPI003FD79A59
MRVDYKKFPDIPPNCQLNAKPNRPGDFQVFRENHVLDEKTGKKKTVRETIGIIKNGQFSFGELWLERQEHRRLLEEVETLRKLVGKNALSQTNELAQISEKIKAVFKMQQKMPTSRLEIVTGLSFRLNPSSSARWQAH